jgi:hypothetical protein
VRKYKWLAWCRHWLDHPALWAVNRNSVAGGFAIGLFAGLIPGPLQMLGATLLAIPLKKNIPVALVTTFYTNPFTIAPLYLLAYGYGRLLLGAGGHPALVGALPVELVGLVRLLQGPHGLGDLARRRSRRGPGSRWRSRSAALGYFACTLGWRLYVVLACARAARRRLARRQTLEALLLVVELFLEVVQHLVADLARAPDADQLLALGAHRGQAQVAAEGEAAVSRPLRQRRADAVVELGAHARHQVGSASARRRRPWSIAASAALPSATRARMCSSCELGSVPSLQHADQRCQRQALHHQRHRDPPRR